MQVAHGAYYASPPGTWSIGAGNVANFSAAPNGLARRPCALCKSLESSREDLLRARELVWPMAAAGLEVCLWHTHKHTHKRILEAPQGDCLLGWQNLFQRGGGQQLARQPLKLDLFCTSTRRLLPPVSLEPVASPGSKAGRRVSKRKGASERNMEAVALTNQPAGGWKTFPPFGELPPIDSRAGRQQASPAAR